MKFVLYATWGSAWAATATAADSVAAAAAAAHNFYNQTHVHIISTLKHCY